MCKFGMVENLLFLNDFFFMNDWFVVFSERYVVFKVKIRGIDIK